MGPGTWAPRPHHAARRLEPEVAGEDRGPAGCSGRVRLLDRLVGGPGDVDDRGRRLPRTAPRRSRRGSRSPSAGSTRRHSASRPSTSHRGGFADPVRNAVALTGGYRRPTSVASSAGSPTVRAATFGDELVDEASSEASASTRCAALRCSLSGETKRRSPRASRRCVGSVRANDRRRRVSEFGFTRLRSRFGERPADAARTGERDQLDPGSSAMSTSPISEAGARDDVHQPGGRRLRVRAPRGKGRRKVLPRQA